LVARSLLYTGPGGAAGVLPVSVKTTLAIAGNAVNVAQETSLPSSQRLLGRHRPHDDAAERQGADRRIHVPPLITSGRRAG